MTYGEIKKEFLLLIKGFEENRVDTQTLAQESGIFMRQMTRLGGPAQNDKLMEMLISASELIHHIKDKSKEEIRAIMPDILEYYQSEKGYILE